jgi:fatty-acyl-CoA synthase
LQAALAGRIARFKQPRDLVLVDALPKSALGKVLRYQLRALVGER